MKSLARLLFIIALGAALVYTYRKLQEEEAAQLPEPETSPRRILAGRIRKLPEAPAAWKLLETAPNAVNADDIPDILPALTGLLESARSRVTFESYFLKKNWGEPGRLLMEAAARQVQVLGVLHPNPMSDAPFLDDLRHAGADIVERDLAPLGGNPNVGYLHAKFVVVDGQRGYIGSANLAAAAMRSNREMGLYFEDASIAQTLELMAALDAGRMKSGLSTDIRPAVLLQGAADGFFVDGIPKCEDGIAALCDLAQKEIDVMIFAFSHDFGKYDAIARPLRAAARRGVKVRLIHDAGTVKELEGVWPTLRDMKQWDIDVRLMDLSALDKSARGQYHPKAMRVDDDFLMVGSNNWTDAGSNENREIALILRSQRLVDQFKHRFNEDWHMPGCVKTFNP